MKVATYNINSVKAHCTNLFDWLKENNPDVVFLQEIKCETDAFLYFEFETLGYKSAVLGQKSYNGVAILSKYDFQITAQNLPNFSDDTASRYIEVLIKKPKDNFYAISIYAPNGCSPDKEVEKEKLKYKLLWFDKFLHRISFLKKKKIPIIVGGDFNIMMEKKDCYDEQFFIGTPLYRKDVKDKLKALENFNLYDTFRFLHPKDEGFTFWDYTGNSFVTNLGLRIDYMFVTSSFVERLKECQVDKSIRQKQKTSDHTILVADFEDIDA